MNTEPHDTDSLPGETDVSLQDAAAVPEDALLPDSALRVDTPPAPRTRWAAIVWGLFFGLIAGAALWLLAAPERLSAVPRWAMDATPGGIAAAVMFTVGVLLLLAGVTGLLRRMQRRRLE